MPIFGGVLSDSEIEAAIAYIKSTWPERERACQASIRPAAAATAMSAHSHAESLHRKNRYLTKAAAARRMRTRRIAPPSPMPQPMPFIMSFIIAGLDRLCRQPAHSNISPTQRVIDGLVRFDSDIRVVEIEDPRDLFDIARL